MHPPVSSSHPSLLPPARYLLQGAQHVVQKLGGRFPETAAEVRSPAGRGAGTHHGLSVSPSLSASLSLSSLSPPLFSPPPLSPSLSLFRCLPASCSHTHSRTLTHSSTPQTPQLRSIPGVGPYTAAAVASIAFGDAAAAVDGNVVRVLARLRALSGDPSKGHMTCAWDRLAAQLLHPRRPGCHNQVRRGGGVSVVPGVLWRVAADRRTASAASQCIAA